jgi:hypothetical protein
LLLFLQGQSFRDRDRRRVAADIDSIGINRLFLLDAGLLTLLESLLPKLIINESVRIIARRRRVLVYLPSVFSQLNSVILTLLLDVHFLVHGEALETLLSELISLELLGLSGGSGRVTHAEKCLVLRLTG